MVFHIRAANSQDFPSRHTAARSQRHMRRSLLFSRVTLCSADVSLGKWLNSKAWLRLCLASLPALAPPAQGETCEPGGESVAKYMFVFRKEAWCWSLWPVPVTSVKSTDELLKSTMLPAYCKKGTELAVIFRCFVTALTSASEKYSCLWCDVKGLCVTQGLHADGLASHKILFKLCNGSNSLLFTTKESKS